MKIGFNFSREKCCIFRCNLPLQDYFGVGIDWEFGSYEQSTTVLLNTYLFETVKNYSDNNLKKLRELLDLKRVFLLIGHLKCEKSSYYILLFAGEFRSTEDLSEIVCLLKTNKSCLTKWKISTIFQTIKKRLQRDEYTVRKEVLVTNKVMQLSIHAYFAKAKIFSTHEQFDKDRLEIRDWNGSNGFEFDEQEYAARRKRKASKLVEIPEPLFAKFKSLDKTIENKNFGCKSIGGKTNSKVIKLPKKYFNAKPKKSVAHLISDFQVSRIKNVFSVPISFHNILEAIKNLRTDMLESEISEVESNNILGAVSSKFFEDIGWHNIGLKPIALIEKYIKMAIDLDQVTLEIKGSCSKNNYGLKELYDLIIKDVSIYLC
jgi:hypothetical protein